MELNTFSVGNIVKKEQFNLSKFISSSENEEMQFSDALVVLLKHLAVFDGGEPKAVGVGVVVAGSPTVTLDKRGAAEFFQAGTRRGQCLTRTLSTGAGVL